MARPKKEKQAKPAAEHVDGSGLFLTNCSPRARGIVIGGKVVMLSPMEMYRVSDEHKREVRAMFKLESFQRLVDSGFLRLGEVGGDPELKEGKTPEAPVELTSPVRGSVENPIGVATGQNAVAPHVVEYQSIGAEG